MKGRLSWIRHPSIVKASLFLAVLLASLKTGDVIFGQIAGAWFGNSYVGSTPRSILLKENPPNLDVYVRPDKSYIANSDGLVGNTVRFRTDRDGFIVGGKEAPGPIDFAFIGGSTTECLYLEEHKRFPAVVARYLVRSDGTPAQTRNAGVSGANSLHSLFTITAKLIPYRPRYVIIMHNINDFSQLSKTGSYWLAPPQRSVVQSGDVHLFDQITSLREGAMALKSWLIPNMWPYLKGLLPASYRPTAPDEFKEFRKTASITHLERLKGDFRASLQSIVALLRAWNVRPILMTQFNRLSAADGFVRSTYDRLGVNLSYEEFVLGYGEFNQVVRDVARELDVPLIDLAKLVPQDRRYIYDSVHLNNEGSLLVAKIIAEHIARFDSSYSLSLE
jgi:lysophospholipase L1-like esterase